jgi:hypothetical protein
MKSICLLACLVLVLAGCSSGSMVVDSPSGQTVYSKYYDAGDWIIAPRLGMSVVIDHEKSAIPIVHSVARSIGALGPGDSFATGKVTVYLWNRDQDPRRVKILKVSSGEAVLAPKSVEFIATGGQRSGGAVGSFDIFNYGTKIPVKVECEVDGTKAIVELTLERRTPEELNRYFGPGGRPPYPWFHDQGKKG